MKLDNFKELLLRKSEDNQNLQFLIKNIKEDYLTDHILESLAKMASQKLINDALKHYGSNSDADTDGGMIHDQLSHHASHYKAALKNNDKNLADKHMSAIHKTMFMLNKLTKDGKENHTGGEINVEAPNPMHWEERAKDGTTSDTYGWGAVYKGTNNFDHMRQAPIKGRSDAEKSDGSIKKYKKDRNYTKIKGHGHNKAYPLEEITINGKHVHIDDDIESTTDFQSHPFDSHPIISHGIRPQGSHSDEHQAKYMSEYDAFHDEGSDADQYYDRIEARDPDEHEARGSSKSDPVHAHINDHEDFEPLDLNEEKSSMLASKSKSAPKRKSKAAAAPVKELTPEQYKITKRHEQEFKDWSDKGRNHKTLPALSARWTKEKKSAGIE